MPEFVVPGTPAAGSCPKCGGRLRVSLIDDLEVACMDCTWASYDLEPDSEEAQQLAALFGRDEP